MSGGGFDQQAMAEGKEIFDNSIMQDWGRWEEKELGGIGLKVAELMKRVANLASLTIYQ